MWRHSKRDTHEPRTEASVKTKTCQHLNLRFSGSRIVRENFWLLKPVVFHQSGPRRLTVLQTNGAPGNGSASSSQGEWRPPSGGHCQQPGGRAVSFWGFKRRGCEEATAPDKCGDALEPPGLFLRIPTTRLHVPSWEFSKHSWQSQQSPSAGQTHLFAKLVLLLSPQLYRAIQHFPTYPSVTAEFPDHLCSIRISPFSFLHLAAKRGIITQSTWHKKIVYRNTKLFCSTPKILGTVEKRDCFLL